MPELASRFADVSAPMQPDAPLGPLTWYGVGGRAALLIRPRDEWQLQQTVHRCREVDVPLYVLGSGANLLVRDAGVDGVVVKLDAPGFAELAIDGERVDVGAGYDLFKLVRELARAGLGGTENLAGIPASLGGAVRMNAGGAFGEIGTLVRQVRVMDVDGRPQTLDRADLVFAYRHCHIDQPLILGVQLQLTPDDPDRLTARMKEIFAYKKQVQPMGAKSAGCAFKNPDDPQANDGSRLSAGRLIDEAGLKGYRIGSAEVSMRHGNFIHVAERGGSADDVLAVMAHVEQVVRDVHGIDLQREVVVW